jgi:KRAB domain-containing zinc finger protein
MLANASLIFHYSSLCGKAFATSTMRNAHEKTHNRNSEVQKYLSRDVNGTVCYRCPNCNDIFDTSDHLKNHIEKNCYRPRKKRTYKYPCRYCGKQFVTKILAAKHYSDDHDVIISNPQKFCFECNAEVEDYVNHIRFHTCQFKCNYCGTKFLTEETCRQHEISKHSVPEDRPFHCNFESCNASFKTEHHLKSHINSIHDHNERLFRCEICNSKFATKSLLTAHLRTHDKDSAIFSCKICGKSFKKLATLKNHSVALHQTDEIYECGIDECQLRYKFLQDLKIHRQNTHGMNLNIQKYFHEGDE